MFGKELSNLREGILRLIIVLSVCIFTLAGCGSDDPQNPTSACVEKSLNAVTGDSGQAFAFTPDPISSSGDRSLSPGDLSLDSYKTPVSLARLGGRGVLEGLYVDVRDGLTCSEGFGAYSDKNDFVYAYSDARFQQAMSYYSGDTYRAFLDSVGYLEPKAPVKIVAHCMKQDNAYFIRGIDSSGQTVGKVCLGDSEATPGASYADDAAVVMHELQHATTLESYSSQQSLNQFFFDEAGALNEAVSDAMTLMQIAPSVKTDSMVFSPWALGSFIPGRNGVRGVHRCPQYDPTYPGCSSFRSDASGFSADQNSISYVYPDGMGWPYANNFTAPGYLRSVFETYTGQEEIHDAGMVMSGAIWDIYGVIRGNHGGNASVAQSLVSKVVLEAIRHLPKPSAGSLSPVTFRGFAEQMVNVAGAVGMGSADQNSLVAALTARGLYGGPLLSSGWAAIGTGSDPTPGMRIETSPARLKSWLLMIGADPAVINQGIDTGLNGKLDAGEGAVIWLDIMNNSALTAGGLKLTVTSLNPNVIILNSMYNAGYMSQSQTQIRYSKVNGTAIVSALSSSNPTYHVATGNSYFKTNPFYKDSYRTGVWIKVSTAAAKGEAANFKVDIEPTNGSAESLVFTTTIE